MEAFAQRGRATAFAPVKKYPNVTYEDVPPTPLASRHSVSDVSHGLKLLRNTLSTKHILIVLDDVFHSQVVEALDFGASILITTQKKDIAERFTSEPLFTENLEPSADEAFSILQKASGTLRVSKSVRDRFFEIIQMCQHHPYAIHTVGRMKRIASISWDEVASRLQNSIDSIEVTERITYNHNNLLGPFAFSIDLLPERTRNKFLQLSVTPGSSTLTLQLLTLLWSDSLEPSQSIRSHLKKLLESSLLFETHQSEEPSYRLHSLVHALILSRNPPSPQQHELLTKRYEERFHPIEFTLIDDPYFWNNYPFHLSEAGLQESLKTTVLSISWLRDKAIKTRDIPGICHDLGLIEDTSCEALIKVVGLSAKAIRREPQQLPVQLLGRTYNLREIDAAVSTIHSQANEFSHTFPVLPRNQCLLSGSANILSSVLSQHSQVECLCVSNNFLISGGVNFGDYSYIHIWRIEQQYTTALLTDLSRVEFQHDGPTALWAALGSPSILVGTLSGRVAILDPESDRLTYFKHSHEKRVQCFTEIDGLFLSGSDDGHINIWDSERMRLVSSIKTPSDMVTGLAASSSGVVAATVADTLVFYQLCNSALSEISRHQFPNTKILTDVESSSNPDIWFIGTSKGELIRYELDSTNEQRIQAHPKIILRLLRCPETRRIVSSSVDPPINIWAEDNISQPATAVHTDRRRSVKALAGTPDGKTLFAGCSFSEIKVLSPSTDSMSSLPYRHHGVVASLIADKKQNQVISISRIGELFTWNCSKGVITSRSNLHLEANESITCAILSENGSRLWTGTSSGIVREYTTNQWTHSSCVQAHKTSITALACGFQSQMLVSAGTDYVINALSMSTSNTKQITVDDSVVPTTLIMTPAGELLSGWNNGKVMKSMPSSVSGGKETTRTEIVHKHSITSLCLHGPGHFASGSADGHVYISNIENLQVVLKCISHDARITHLLSLGESTLLVADDSGQCAIWNTDRSEVIANYFGDFQFICGSVHETFVCLGDSEGFVHILQSNLPLV